MRERTFRIIFGCLLLIGLYFDLRPLVWTLIGILLFQGLTNWRVSRLVSRLRYGAQFPLNGCCAHSPDTTPTRINFEAERVLCLGLSLVLIPSYGPYQAELWLAPWIIGFALFGAGLSGLCPMVLGLKRVGFR